MSYQILEADSATKLNIKVNEALENGALLRGELIVNIINSGNSSNVYAERVYTQVVTFKNNDKIPTKATPSVRYSIHGGLV